MSDNNQEPVGLALNDYEYTQFGGDGEIYSGSYLHSPNTSIPPPLQNGGKKIKKSMKKSMKKNKKNKKNIRRTKKNKTKKQKNKNKKIKKKLYSKTGGGSGGVEEAKSGGFTVSNSIDNLKYYLDEYSKATNDNERELIKDDIYHIIQNTEGRIPQYLLLRVQGTIGGVRTLQR
jgi:hypothetical protein